MSKALSPDWSARSGTSDRPRITIVTVCLNDRSGLEATFESVRMQSQPPHQWIVVDGHSSDGTREWLQSLQWSGLTWISEPDAGIYDAMNKGLSRVNAEYVLFLNSGDELAAPGVLTEVLSALGRHRSPPTLLFGDCYEVDAAGRSHLRRARPAWWSVIGMPTTHQAMYFRVDAIGEGFDTRYHLSGDYAAVTAMYMRQRGRDFVHLPIPLCRFMLGGLSTSRLDQLLRENLDIRRRVLRMGTAPVMTLHLLHHVHGIVKRRLPFLHRLVRYG